MTDLLCLIAARGAVFVADIAGELGVSSSAASARLRKLEREGMLVAELVGGGRLRYGLSDRGRAATKHESKTPHYDG